MTRHKVTISAVAIAFSLSALPVLAGQRPEGGAGGGPGGGGGAGSGSGGASGGSASSGSSGGGGSSTSSGGGASSSSSGSSDGSSASAPAPSRREAAAERAPQRPGAASGERRGGGDRSRGEAPATGRAVPRGTTPSGRDTSTSTSSSGSSDRGRDRDRASSSPGDRAVPAYSRPRDGRPATGRATDRFRPAPDPDGRNVYYHSRYPYGYYYDPYGYYGSYWYPGYSFGLGYFYYDPFWYGGYGYQGGGGYGGGYSGSYSYGESGSLRLKIKPRDAQVFVDGYFVGNVDSFDGVFQRLNVETGGHKIEIRAPGHETLQFDVLITPGETVTYKGELVRVQ